MHKIIENCLFIVVIYSNFSGNISVFLFLLMGGGGGKPENYHIMGFENPVNTFYLNILTLLFIIMMSL